MADFDTAHLKTSIHEGGYSHHPNDKGGETAFGIARVKHASWSGWSIVDAVKASLGNPSAAVITRELKHNSNFMRMVREFYRLKFWDDIGGDSIPTQALADELYDAAVNIGPATAVKWMQRSVNALNKRAALIADIRVDGDMGPTTIAALRAISAAGGADELQKLCNCLQGCHYLTLAESDQTQEAFMWGWLSRI